MTKSTTWDFVACSSIQWQVMYSFSAEYCCYWVSWCSWESITVYLIQIRSSLDLCWSSLNSLKKDRFRMCISSIITVSYQPNIKVYLHPKYFTFNHSLYIVIWILKEEFFFKCWVHKYHRCYHSAEIFQQKLFVHSKKK